VFILTIWFDRICKEWFFSLKKWMNPSGEKLWIISCNVALAMVAISFNNKEAFYG